MPNGIKQEVEEVLKQNGWISNVEIAHKIHEPVQKVDRVLLSFKKKGQVDARPAK